MTPRDEQRLVGVHPDLIAALEIIFDEMDADKTPMMVIKGLRTQAEQMALYAQGRTTPGVIVTFKDGVTHPSNHQPRADGFGHAVDCGFLGPQPFDLRHPWNIYGERVEAHGLIWGGRWSHPHDSPHAELPESTT
jgi:peptidoglycan L-alanyl-D-glutamate endopeptidase CwlK